MAELLDEELKFFEAHHHKSREMRDRGILSMPLGVPSTLQDFEPYPIYVHSASGSHMQDVDGNDYVDFHLGFGVLAAGHSHPKLVKAITDQLTMGTVYGTPCDHGIELSELLCKRFNMDRVRLSTSGTEATMDTVRLARGVTGKSMVVKIEGCYHGHHDYLMMSVKPPTTEMGPPKRPCTVPASKGIPPEVSHLTLVAPYNDADALAGILEENRGKIAAVIMEPVMFNIGVVLPQDGYLEQVRKLTRDKDVVLIFDEVKTGATVAWGGAQEKYHVKPDLMTLAKAIGGGFPIAVLGGREDLMSHLRWGEVSHMGTFNGSPLQVRAGLVTLNDILTPDVYTRFDMQQATLIDGYETIIKKYQLPMYAVGVGGKGGVMFLERKARNYRGYVGFDHDLAYAHWLYFMNRGFFMGPGFDEQWTLSVPLTDEEIDRHLRTFEGFARFVAPKWGKAEA